MMILKKIKNRVTPQLLDSATAFAIRVASAFASYVLFVLVARSGSLQQYESFAYLFTIVGFFGPLANFGGVGIGYKHLSNSDRINSGITAKKLKLILTATLVGWFFYSIIALLILASNTHFLFHLKTFLFVIGLIFLSGYLEVLFAYNRISVGAKASLAIKELLWRGLFLLGIFILKAIDQLDINSLLGLLTFAYFISASILVNRIKDSLIITLKEESFYNAIPIKEFATFSLLSALGMAFVHIDNIIVGSIMPENSLGAFFSSQRVIQILYFFSQSIGIFASTLVRVAYQNNNIELIRRSSRSNAILAGSGALICGLVIALFSSEVLALFRPEFSNQNLILILLLIGPIAYAFGGYHSIIPVYCGAESLYLKYRLICFGLFFILKIYLASFSNILVYSTIVSVEAIAITLVGAWVSKRKCKVPCF